MTEKAMIATIHRMVPKTEQALIARFREAFALDEKTGVLLWKIRTSNRTRVGARAGYLQPDRYRVIRIDSGFYKEHHVVFAMVHGFMPRELDHINRIENDNRPANLREATRSQNNINRLPPSNNTSGVTGVTWCASHNKWQAYTKVAGRYKFIGRFALLEDAAEARRLAVIETYGEFAP